jgi:hypothetical protein
MSELYKQLQTDLKAIGLYAGVPDGSWGPLSQGAFLNARRQVLSPPVGMSPLLLKYCRSVAWSAKVSDEFNTLVTGICLSLGCPSDYLMSCMAFETGETFSPTIANGAGAPYYGLIQFGKAAATDVNTTVADLVKMTAEQQLEYVYRFFKPYANKLKTLSDIYSRIIWPRAVGKPEDYIIFIDDGKSKAYFQNKGIDLNKDGKITKAECAAKVTAKLLRGLDPSNLKVV